MMKCSYCMLEDAKYEITSATKVAGKECSLTMKVCIGCMPVNTYLLKEYKCL